MTAARNTQQRWVLLADPESYGWNELQKAGNAVWDGIKNARAQQNMKQVGIGDLVLIYNTAPDKAIMGLARVTRSAYPDPAAPVRVVIDVEALQPLARPLPLAQLKADPTLRHMSFVKMPRIAVQPVTTEQFDEVLRLSGTPAVKP